LIGIRSYVNSKSAEPVCWPSTKLLSIATELDRKTVQASIKFLKDAGFITATERRVGATGQTIVYAIAVGRTSTEVVSDDEIEPIDGDNSTEIGPLEDTQKRASLEIERGPDFPIKRPVFPHEEAQYSLKEAQKRATEQGRNKERTKKEQGNGESAHTPELADVPSDLLADYRAVRKAKKAGPITNTVIAGLRREAAKAGVTLAEAIATCCEAGWQGFRADWYANRMRQQSGGSSQNPRSGPLSDADREAANKIATEEARRMLFGPNAKKQFASGDVIDAETMLVEPGRQSDIFGVLSRTGQQALAQGRQHVAEPWAGKQAFARPSSKHSGFEQQNYQDGINEDGSIAA
jgi:hypothetical protein